MSSETIHLQVPAPTGSWSGTSRSALPHRYLKARADALGRLLKVAVGRKSKTATDLEIVDAIDASLGSAAGLQHAWAQEKWHALDRAQKLAWVIKHQEYLELITRSKSSTDTIIIMQNAEIDLMMPRTIMQQIA